MFEHLISKDVKPNAMTYRLLVEAHLVNRDPKAAISVLDQMVGKLLLSLHRFFNRPTIEMYKIVVASLETHFVTIL